MFLYPAHIIALLYPNPPLHKEKKRTKDSNCLSITSSLCLFQIGQMVHSDFVGLGMRIEDDVLITSGDPDVLTSACPVDLPAMERLAAS